MMRRIDELRLELDSIDTCTISDCRNCAIDRIRYRDSGEPKKLAACIRETKEFWNAHCRFCGFEITEREKRFSNPYPWKVDKNGYMYRMINPQRRSIEGEE